ncbi:hypothetical protein G9A89_005163 [Geosiphon pyriformis]|nr:hypothetical protein G9A89_005163 [Geosiphon pyriformis]
MSIMFRLTPLPFRSSIYIPVRRFSQSTCSYAKSKTHQPKPKRLSKLSAPVYDTVTLDDGSLFVARVPLNPPPPIKISELPPAIKPIPIKRYHITEQEVLEMQKLREENPQRWTRKALADKFDCSPFFVGIAAPTSEELQERLQARQQRRAENYSHRRKHYAKLRQLRRKMW